MPALGVETWTHVARGWRLGQNPRMARQFATSYLTDVIALLRYYKKLGDRAIDQTPDEALTSVLDPEPNSIAIIVKHLAGNMRSR